MLCFAYIILYTSLFHLPISKKKSITKSPIRSYRNREPNWFLLNNSSNRLIWFDGMVKTLKVIIIFFLLFVIKEKVNSLLWLMMNKKKLSEKCKWKKKCCVGWTIALYSISIFTEQIQCFSLDTIQKITIK